jgi:dTDP-4-amino-4,6-dideoxygalactose transaminase
MGEIRTLIDIGRRQARNFRNFLLGRNVTLTPLGSMTLDWDDVALARHWLDDRSKWVDNSIVTRYEQLFAEWAGFKYAFAFASGRASLSAAIYALGLQPGDEVILPAYTCVAVPNAFHFAGITINYCDIELDTCGPDAKQVEVKISPRTKAIMLHHLFGLVCRDYEALLELASVRNLKVIEDCAHAAGATYKGMPVGRRGDIAFFSSEQSKIFNTIQGGVAATNDEEIGERLKRYYERAPHLEVMRVENQLYNIFLNYYQCKHHQRWWRGDYEILLHGRRRLISTTPEEERGLKPSHYGAKMPPAVAALGINQLRKIDMYNGRRRESAREWDNWCEKHGYARMLVLPDSVPVYLRYPLLVEPEKKANRTWAARELGVELGVWFVSHVHPAPERIGGCPNADAAVRQCINFPTLFPR